MGGGLSARAHHVRQPAFSLAKPRPPVLRLGGVAVDLDKVRAITLAFNGRMIALGLQPDGSNCVPPLRVAELLEALAAEIRRVLA